MEENTNSQIQVIWGNSPEELEALNAKGCSFFIDPKQSEEIFVSTSQLRWLTHEREYGGYFTTEQKRALETIEADVKDTSTPLMHIKLLLYSDPRNLYKKPRIKNEQKDNWLIEEKRRELVRDVIEKLLLCGDVDVRYLEKDEKDQLRIELRDKELFLSFSSKDKNNGKQKKVHCGVVYTADNNNDPLISYYRELFKKDFDRARKMRFDGKKIVSDEKRKDQFKRWVKANWSTAILPSLIVSAIFFILGFLIPHPIH